jgi:hypothetical protein
VIAECFANQNDSHGFVTTLHLPRCSACLPAACQWLAAGESNGLPALSEIITLPAVRAEPDLLI